MPRLGGAYSFRRVRSQRKSVDRGTMGPALGGAYVCNAHISSCQFSSFSTRVWNVHRQLLSHSTLYLATLVDKLSSCGSSSTNPHIPGGDRWWAADDGDQTPVFICHYNGTAEFFGGCQHHTLDLDLVTSDLD